MTVVETDQDMPVPALAPAFALSLAFGPAQPIGRLATGGTRSVRPARSGRIEGRGLDAEILSGTETCLTRRDGVTTVELALVAMPPQGKAIRMIGTGVSCAGSEAGLRMNMVFEVEDGAAHDWLATRVFIAERPVGTELISIFEVV